MAGEGEVDPEVTIDDVARGAVDEHLGDPADLAQGAGEGSLLVLGVGPPVPRVRDQFPGRHVGMPDDPIPPGGRGRQVGSTLHRGASGVMDAHRIARRATTSERTNAMDELRKCIGSARFGIEPHEAPVADFPVQPSQKDGLGRLCKVHWKAYTTALRKAAAAAKTEATPVAETEPGPPVTKPSRRAKAKDATPVLDVEEASAE